MIFSAWLPPIADFVPASQIGLMTGFKVTATLGIAGLVAACATLTVGAKEPTVGADYFVSSRLNDDEAMAWVSIHSLSKEPLCMSVVDWPNKLGRIGEGGATILSDAVERPVVSSFNYGTCVGAQCFLRIEPGQSLQGFIAYSEFGDPDAIKALPNKRLRFSPHPTFCGRLNNKA